MDAVLLDAGDRAGGAAEPRHAARSPDLVLPAAEAMAKRSAADQGALRQVRVTPTIQRAVHYRHHDAGAALAVARVEHGPAHPVARRRFERASIGGSNATGVRAHHANRDTIDG